MRFLFLTLLFLVSCATEVPTSQLSSEKTPFLKRYKKKSKELLYIVTKEMKSEDQETRILIEKIVKRFDPEIVVTGLSVEKKSENYKELSKCELDPKNCAIEYWACTYVKPRGIPCISGEPYHSDILQEAQKRNLAADEILFYYTYRAMTQKEKSSEEIFKSIPQILEEQKSRLNMVSNMTKDDFIAQYKNSMGRGPIVLNKSNLKENHNGNYLQRLSATIAESYESLIFQKIRNEQLSHERVMVIYPLPYFKKHMSRLEKFFSTELP